MDKDSKGQRKREDAVRGCSGRTQPRTEQKVSNLRLYQSVFGLAVQSVMLHRLVGLVVNASASRAKDLGFESRLRRDFTRSIHTSDLKIGTPALLFQAPGDMGSALGLVGPVSVYCDWVK